MTVRRNPARTDSKLAANAVFRKKISAFVISCAAVFLMLVMFLSMSEKAFVAESLIQVSASPHQQISDIEIEDYVSQAWDDQLASDQLDSTIESLSETMHLKHPEMLAKNFDRLRKRLTYDLQSDLGNGQIGIRVSLEGGGSEAENGLVDLISINLASAMSGIVVPMDDVQSNSLVASAEDLNRIQVEYLDRVEQLADQIESGVEVVCQEVANSKLLANDPSAVASKTDNDIAPRPRFINASHSLEAGESSRLETALDAIDTLSLRTTLAQIRQVADEQVALQKKQQSYFQAAASRHTTAFLVMGLSRSQSRPAGGTPANTTMFAFGLASLLLGGVIAWGYAPLKDDVGFSSLEQVTAKLNLPVLTTLKRRSEPMEWEDDLPLSNLVFQLARVILLGMLVIIAVGLCISPAIRAAFVENPYNGFSHIVWNLLGK